MKMNRYYDAGDPTGGQPDGGAPSTDSSGLIFSLYSNIATKVYVSADGGNTNESNPVPDVEYDFCAYVTNAGSLPSGPFSVLFHITGDDGSATDLTFSSNGLNSKDSVLAIEKYGAFPNKFVNYQLVASIYTSDPSKPIDTATLGIVINTASTNSGSGSNPSPGGDAGNSSDNNPGQGNSGEEQPSGN